MERCATVTKAITCLSCKSHPEKCNLGVRLQQEGGEQVNFIGAEYITSRIESAASIISPPRSDIEKDQRPDNERVQQRETSFARHTSTDIHETEAEKDTDGSTDVGGGATSSDHYFTKAMRGLMEHAKLVNQVNDE